MNTIVRLTDKVRSEIGNKNNKPAAMASQILEQRNVLFNRNKSNVGRKRRNVETYSSASKIPRQHTWQI